MSRMYLTFSGLQLERSQFGKSERNSHVRVEVKEFRKKSTVLSTNKS